MEESACIELEAAEDEIKLVSGVELRGAIWVVDGAGPALTIDMDDIYVNTIVLD